MSKANQLKEKILVIKLGALGDFIQSFSPARAIRGHHKDAHISLLTTKPFQKFAQESGYFDAIHLDKKPKWFDAGGWLALRQWMNAQNFTRVYDLQNNDRSGFYFRLLNQPKPEWVGTAKAASHRNTSPSRTQGHAFDGHKETLSLAGITDIAIDDLSFIDADIAGFDLRDRYVLLVPGCAPSRPLKRWPAKNYAALANKLADHDLQPVLIGTKDDKEATDYIASSCAAALNLNSQTTLEQIIVLARGAYGAIGNDTGPMHMIAPTGCPSLVLFSNDSNPVKHRPLGPKVEVIQKDVIGDIDLDTVWGHFERLRH